MSRSTPVSPMPAAFGSPGSEFPAKRSSEPWSVPQVAFPHRFLLELRTEVIARVASDPDLLPHLSLLMGTPGDREEVERLCWVREMPTDTLLAWVEAMQDLGLADPPAP